MRFEILVCALVVLSCVCAEKKIVKCPENAPRLGGCGSMTCYEDGSVSGVGCGTHQCAEGKEIGYKETDEDKPYPECCGGPICA